MTGLALSNLGRIAARARRFEEARTLFDRADAQFRGVGDLGQEIENLARQAEADLFRCAWEEALRTAGDARAKTDKLGGVAPQVPLLERVTGYALAGLGRTDEARVALEASAQAARERDAMYELALTLRALAQVFPDDERSPEWTASASAILDGLGVVWMPAIPLASA